MGTSSSYNGPTGRNPLLPPWAPDPPLPEPEGENVPGENPDEPNETPNGPPVPNIPVMPLVSWSGAKGIVSRIGNGRPTGSWKSACRSYTRAHGGGRTAARSASGGRAATGRLGSFLSDVVRNGVVEASRHVGLTEFIGRDAQTLLAALIDILAPDGALLEAAAARKALIETLSELFDRYDVEGQGLEALNSVDADGMKEIIALSVTNYIYERFEHELFNCLERGSVSESEANNLAEEAKEFIAGVVTIDMDEINVVTFDWDGAEGKQFVENLYQTAYSLLEDN